MRRPDLKGKGADGWQAIDATPQEESKGPNESPFSSSNYFCGPAPHALIRSMDVQQPYDVAFVAGEANCLKVDFVDGKEVNRDPNTVGENIATKAPDNQCNGERKEENGYTAVCKQNLARSYSKQGSFLQVAQMMRDARFAVCTPHTHAPSRSVALALRRTLSVRMFARSVLR
jgi:hypothetical protein